MPIKVLVVEDDENTRTSLRLALEADGYVVQLAPSAEVAMQILQRGLIDAVITDLMMDQMSGLDLLGFLRERHMETILIMMTAYSTIESAVEAIRRGAWDYIPKPVDVDKLSLLIRQGVTNAQRRVENRVLKQQLRERFSPHSILGKSPAIQRLLAQIELIARTEATVLIQGESGTGKELIAEALHYNSLRADRPLVKVNCGIFAEGVVESELFGHEKGAYTGAIQQKKGRFELATTGSLFLDEVGELTPTVQVKLLRVLQDQVFERVGGVQPIAVDVRLVAATNKELEHEVQHGRFREDLYYRLNVIPVKVPPLRERREDIPLLIEHFLRVFTHKHQKGMMDLSREALELCVQYPWPGNVRELRNCVESLVVLATHQPIACADLPTHIQRVRPMPTLAVPLGSTLAQIEKGAILGTLDITGGNKHMAARLLGIGVKTLYRRLEEYRPS
jgi:DNA-binding NtrC family response regulator